MAKNKTFTATESEQPITPKESVDAGDTTVSESNSETIEPEVPAQSDGSTVEQTPEGEGSVNTEESAETTEVVPPTETTSEPEAKDPVSVEPTPAEPVTVTADVSGDLGEPQTVETAPDAPVVEHDPYAGFNIKVRTLLEMVDNHIQTLTPGRPVNADKGIASQRTFSTTLVNIFRVPDAKDFIACMDLLIKRIVEHKDGAFNEKHAFRHWSQLPLSPERLKAFEYNLSALLTMAKTEDRKQAFRSIDFTTAFSNLTDQERNRVVTYFKRMSGA